MPPSVASPHWAIEFAHAIKNRPVHRAEKHVFKAVLHKWHFFVMTLTVMAN